MANPPIPQQPRNNRPSQPRKQLRKQVRKRPLSNTTLSPNKRSRHVPQTDSQAATPAYLESQDEDGHRRQRPTPQMDPDKISDRISDGEPYDSEEPTQPRVTEPSRERTPLEELDDQAHYERGRLLSNLNEPQPNVVTLTTPVDSVMLICQGLHRYPTVHEDNDEVREYMFLFMTMIIMIVCLMTTSMTRKTV